MLSDLWVMLQHRHSWFWCLLCLCGWQVLVWLAGPGVAGTVIVCWNADADGHRGLEGAFAACHCCVKGVRALP
jgi:hypothetical protein